MMRLPDFDAWAMFACVVEHRSFSAAADAIGVSKATISKAIARLEIDLGQTLFHRTSRRLTLTQSGHTLAEHAQRILAAAQAADEAARDSARTLAGLIRVAAPMTFGLRYLAPLVAAFLADHPGVQIDLNLSDNRVDIVGEGYDVAIRIADLPDSTLRGRRLGPVQARMVAAPSYLARRGTPTHPSQLAEHDCFAYTNLSTPWRFYGPDNAEVLVRPVGPLMTNSGDAMLPALRAGLGIAMLPDFIVDADIVGGRLVAILTDWTAPPVSLHLLTPPGNLRPTRVEALIAFFAERIRALSSAEQPG